MPRARRPFLCDAGCPAPEATYPDGDPDKGWNVSPKTCAPLPSLFGLAPGGVCRAVSVAGNAVRSYRTVSPLPRPIHNAAAAVCSLWHCPWGCPRRMLSGTVCPGARTFLPGRLSAIAGAAVRPTDGLGMGPRGFNVKTGGTPFWSAHVKRPALFPSAPPALYRRPAVSAAGNRGRSAAFARSESWRRQRCRRPAKGGSDAGKR